MTIIGECSQRRKGRMIWGSILVFDSLDARLSMQAKYRTQSYLVIEAIIAYRTTDYCVNWLRNIIWFGNWKFRELYVPGRACEDVCEGEADGWVVVPVAVPAPWTLLVGTPMRRNSGWWHTIFSLCTREYVQIGFYMFTTYYWFWRCNHFRFKWHGMFTLSPALLGDLMPCLSHSNIIYFSYLMM
jgi:hypothetical protein